MSMIQLPQFQLKVFWLNIKFDWIKTMGKKNIHIKEKIGFYIIFRRQWSGWVRKWISKYFFKLFQVLYAREPNFVPKLNFRSKSAKSATVGKLIFSYLFQRSVVIFCVGLWGSKNYGIGAYYHVPYRFSMWMIMALHNL